MVVVGEDKLLSLEQVLQGNFGVDLRYHVVPLVEALLALATVEPAPKCEASPIVVRAEAASPSKGSGVPSFQVISCRRSVVADFALGKDVGGDTIGRRLCQKCNIKSFLSKSPIVIDIADGDDLSEAEADCSHRQGKTIVMGGCSTSPLASNDVPSKLGSSTSSAPGVYLPGCNLTPSSLLSD